MRKIHVIKADLDVAYLLAVLHAATHAKPHVLGNTTVTPVSVYTTGRYRLKSWL
jgi:hypothetical protein